MTTTGKQSWSRRIIAAAGTLMIGVAGLAAGALNANAATAGVGNINADTTTSLTIHKYSNANPGAAGDGSELSDTSALGDPLQGVEFTITPVTAKGGATIDLDTAHGWDLIDGITEGTVAATDVTEANGYTLSTATTATTDASGNATKTLPHGLYLVTETGYGDNAITSPSAPFLVTLPLAQTNGSWLYDVHVYPKNTVDTNVPTKDVAKPSDGVILGSTVPWTITAPVQPSTPGDISSFVVTDQLDSRLTFVSAVAEGYDAADYTVSNSNGLVTLTFTNAGLAKLSAGDVVTITLKTTVNSLGDGVIPNQATVITNNGTGKTTSKPNEPGTNPTTNWGPLEVLKYAKDDTAKTLAGAEFEVYSDASATTKVGSFTTDTNGKGTITLWVGNDSDTEETYYLKEIKAPAGYTLDDQIRTVSVKAGSTASEVYKIENTQKGHPTLPLTGAAGLVLMTIVGVALIGAGVVAYMGARKHEANR